MTVHVVTLWAPVPADALVINTTSRSRNWSRGLSPMILGPVVVDGLTACNVENGWQYSKVYAQHWNENAQSPTDEWYRWREVGFTTPRGIRYPMGKGAKPVCSWLHGKSLGYIQARKQIYIPRYAEAVRNTEAFDTLYRLYEDAGEIYLQDFDAYDRGTRTWPEIIDNPKRTMGHAFVLAMLLEGFL